MFGVGHFRSREDAGHQLCDHMPDIDPLSTVVVALPRGGVPVGAVIAERFRLPLDVLLIRKIGVPGHRELALGAVSDGEKQEITVNEDVAAALRLDSDDIRELAERELPELERRRQLFMRGRPPIPLNGKTVVLADDGVATGATMRSAIRIVRQRQPEHIILALPVAPRSTLAMLRPDVDEVVCLLQPEPFISVGSYFSDFGQVDNLEVVDLLRRCNRNNDNGGKGAA
ncbi:phosphoribosyltransferase [Hoeflea sp. TYP-13]|uniref:phosphoribosyltransferase n=1 Tax=Hoeflea sp. TYP-13 TaxID=3230023 RepID=UPI0034C5B42B